LYRVGGSDKYPKYELKKKPQSEKSPIEEVGDLTREERRGLRGLLTKLGIKLTPDKSIDKETDEYAEKVDLSRRKFIKGAAAAAATYGAAKVGLDLLSSKDEEIKVEPETLPEKENINNEDVNESIEENSGSERFNSEIEGYYAFTKLRKDEVLFLDEHNRPVGKPQKFKDFTVYRPATAKTPQNQIRKDGTVAYKLAPGELNEIGVPEGNVAPEWSDYVQEMLQAENPDQKITGRLNVVNDFLAAHSEADEPELVAAIARGEINSYDEIISYFAEKKVVGNEDYNRMEYASEKIEFVSSPAKEKWGRAEVPMFIQDKLRQLIPGWFAQESKFNAGLVSISDAAGLAQIKPKTWWEYTREKEFDSKEEEDAEWERVKDDIVVSRRMDKQIEVAGYLVFDNYHYIQHYADENNIAKLQSRFTTEESFQEDLMVPLMINAYNAGGPTIGRLVKEFVGSVPESEWEEGKDLFLQIADFGEKAGGKLADNKSEARKYVPKVYGNAKMLTEKYPEKNN